MANHGTVFKTRFALMRERIEAMKAIWGNDVAEYHGEHVKFEPLWAWPKPVQKPNPPILVGFPHGAKRAIAFGDAGCRSAAGASMLWKSCPATGRWRPKPAAIMTMRQ